MSFNCEDVARAALGEPQRRGTELVWRCPNHDDQHPSLMINPRKNVWLCGPCGEKGNAWALAAFLAHCSPDDKKAVMAFLDQHGLSNGHPVSAGHVVAEYVYRNADGQPVHKTTRYPSKGGRKVFSQSHYDRMTGRSGYRG